MFFNVLISKKVSTFLTFHIPAALDQKSNSRFLRPCLSGSWGMFTMGKAVASLVLFGDLGDIHSSLPVLLTEISLKYSYRNIDQLWSIDILSLFNNYTKISQDLLVGHLLVKLCIPFLFGYVRFSAFRPFSPNDKWVIKKMHSLAQT